MVAARLMHMVAARLMPNLLDAMEPSGSPSRGAAQLGQRARGVVSFHLRTSHGRGV